MAGSRERARALVIEGKVLVDGACITKAGTPIPLEARVGVTGEGTPYVSRGGLRLKAALRAFAIPVENAVAMDVGASTGGSTDCLLQRGAKKVYCIDVGLRPTGVDAASGPTCDHA
jgi:23S rRNA (cytidine1920-2'-O)/16S rRNA (cytidine1409-2'-O)-methyltransferase